MIIRDAFSVFRYYCYLMLFILCLLQLPLNDVLLCVCVFGPVRSTYFDMVEGDLPHRATVRL